jgi:hypothetical protein
MPAMVFVGGGHAGDLILEGGFDLVSTRNDNAPPSVRGQCKIPGKVGRDFNARFGILTLPQPCQVWSCPAPCFKLAAQ